MLALVAAAVLPCAFVAGQKFVSLSSQQVLAAAGAPRIAPLNEPIPVSLRPGSGVLLECADNAAGIGRVAVVLGTDSQLWVTAVDREGYTIEHTSSMADSCHAMLKQVGRTGVVIFGKWTRPKSAAKPGIECELRLSSDRLANQRLRDRAAAQTDGRTAVLLRNGAPFLPREIPEDERIAGWARLWSEVKHNFAFFDQVPDLDWDAELLNVLPAVRAAAIDKDYYRVLQRSMAKLRDGHTHAYGPGLGIQGGARLPIALGFDLDRKLRIARVLPLDRIRSETSRAAVEQQDLRSGDRITHWNGQRVDALLEAEIRPLICASTPQGNDLTAARMLAAGPFRSEVKLRIERDGQPPREVTLRRARYPVPSRLSGRFEVRELGDGVLYVNLPSFGSQRIVRQFEAALPKVRAAKALVFDVRGNGGGNSGIGWAIASHVLQEPIPKTHWKTPLYRPAYRAWGRPEAWHKGLPGFIPAAKDAFAGPVAILTGPATFSAAEDFVVVLHAAKRAVVVGRPTGGSTGQPLRIQLPGGGGARICTKRDTYPDGKDFVGVGIQPDVVVDPLRQPSVEDPELQAAIEAMQARLRAKK